MDTKYKIDDLDQKILRHLIEDGRRPFLDIARDLSVSGGTIHQRVEKLEQIGILKGYRAVVDREKLGYPVTVLVGIHLKNARDCFAVLETLKAFPEVLEIHYTTGNYALMVKIAAPSMQYYYSFLTSRLQSLDEIQSTESFICMSSPLEREVEP